MVQTTFSYAQVNLSSSVLFSIGEIYQRRNEASGSRVVGALFGSVQSKESTSCSQVVLEIRHCFAVPHSEVGDQISLNNDYYKSRFELHKKAYGRSSGLLGWFYIADGSFEISAKNTEFIEDAFRSEIQAQNSSPALLRFVFEVSSNGISKECLVRDVSKGDLISSSIKVVFPAGSISIGKHFLSHLALNPVANETIQTDESHKEASADIEYLQSAFERIKSSPSAKNGENVQQLKAALAAANSSATIKNIETLQNIVTDVNEKLENMKVLIGYQALA